MRLPEDVLKIIKRVSDVGGEAYVVGGAVRDSLMGLEPTNDIDITVVGLTRGQLNDAFPGCDWVGQSFPVMLVDGYEVAMARTEKKVGTGHVAFECETDNVTLKDDLFRRDLSVNAIAFDIRTYQYVDPFGGIEDINDRVLLPTSHAFSEDPLRVFRAARFVSQLHMAPGAVLLEVCHQMREDLKSLSAERVLGEMAKAFKTDRPSRFFVTLERMHVLDVWFHEISDLIGREQPEKYHPEGDTFMHAMLVLDRARELGATAPEMFGALVHDLGKAVTNSEAPAWHHFNHEALGVPLVEQMGERLRVPSDWIRVGRKAAKWHLNVHRFLDMRACKRVDLVTRLGDDLESVALVSQADAQGRGPDFKELPYLPRAALREAHAAYWTVRGDESMGKGPKVAEKLRRLRTQAFREHGMGK